MDHQSIQISQGIHQCANLPAIKGDMGWTLSNIIRKVVLIC